MKKILFLSIFAALALLAGCEKGDGEKEMGLQVIYMPQATTSAGLNNHYKVPTGDGRFTYNFTVDETGDRVNVLLGVLLSGTAKSNGYAVDVQALTDKTQTLIDAGTIDNGLLLPAASYTLPEKVTVGKGANAASFTLSIDKATIDDHANAGKTLLLEVGISNPSAYQLAEKNTSTLVLINVDVLKDILELL